VKIIRKEIAIIAPVDKVWSYLSNPKKIATWFLPTDFEARVGKGFTLRCERQGTIQCEVREIVSCEKLVYSFKPVATKAETLVTFVLSQLGEQTKVIVTHSGWETLPSPEEATFEMFEQGWGARFLNRLKQVIETEQGE